MAVYPPAMPNDTSPDDPTLSAATLEEVSEALSYALRYDERGKPRRGGWDFAAGLAAERLVEHLKRSGSVVMKARPSRPHSAG